MCLIAPTVSSFEVIPDEIQVELGENQYTKKDLQFTNILNHTINISLETDLPVTFSKPSFSLEVNDSINITVYLFGQESNGIINITYDNKTFEVPVEIDISEDETDDDENITLFPPLPNSGEMFIIAISEPEDLSGFIWLNNKVYPVEITDGFAIIELDKEVYGDASLWLYGKGFVYNFTVECGLEGNAIIACSESKTIGDILDVKLNVGSKVLTDSIITVTDPDGIQYTYETDDNGMIYPVLDKIGEWILRAEFREKQTVKKVKVSHKTMKVSINNKDINLGETVTITTDEEEADIIIKREGVSQFQKTIDTGMLEYNPTLSGSYTVEAESGDSRGTTSFKVNMQTSIRILDKNNMQTSIIRQGQEYIIQVVDEKNQPIALYQSITAEKKYQTAQTLQSGNIYSEPMVTIPLNNGVGFWEPRIHGTYTLSVETTGDYIGSNLNINIERNVVVEEDQTLLYVVIAIVVVIIVLFILNMLYKKGLINIPDLPKRKKIPDKLL